VSPAVIDLERLFLDNLALIDRIVAAIGRRHRLTREEREDFRSVLMIKLIANDYEVLRAWCGKSSLGGYLKVVIHHAYRDHRNHVLGKWRPSAEACRLGPLAKKLDTMLYRDGMTLDEACAAAAPADREEMRRLAERLPAHTKRRMEDVEQLEEMPSSGQSPEQSLIERERASAAERLERALAEALGTLSSEDRLLVQLRTERGVKLANLARLAGVEPRPFYRRWDLIVARLRKSLEASGYDKERMTWLFQTRLLAEVDEGVRTGPSSSTG
jgi:RNA polymerase sigma factor (sigma-70 family)